MNFGKQEVTIVSITEDLDQRDENNDPLIVRTETVVSGVRFRPMTAKEQFELGLNTIRDPWKCTAPPVPAILDAKSIDAIEYQGETYQITGGVRPFTALNQSKPFKVTILCERADG